MLFSLLDDQCRFNDPFYVIPTDLIRIVLGRFTIEEIAIVARVSRRWRAAANDPYV